MGHSANSSRLRQFLAAFGRELRARRRAFGDALLTGGLHALLIAVYAVTVYALVLALGGFSDLRVAPPLHLTLIALFLFALGVVPLSRWLRRRLDSLITSWPDDPYGAINQLQAELSRDPAPRAIVPAVVATITATLKLPYGAITSPPDGERVSVGVAPPNAERLTIPLRFGDTLVGALEVAARRPGVTFSADELTLVYSLARQVGITLHAAQLSEALQTSRAQLVAAREEERRRIRRDLHDGLGPTLAALRLQLGAARRTLRDEPAAAEALLDELRADVAAATAAIRRLVYDLRPPLLDEHGLVGALRSLGRLVEPLPLWLELPDELPSLPAAVEVALYRIAAEALHNVARHARATSCTLRLELTDESVALHVCDDGVGLPAGHRAGVGLAAMHERAEELGGSVVVAQGANGVLTVTTRIPRKAVR
jgi:two-component system NarL family sensor kinase